MQEKTTKLPTSITFFFNFEHTLNFYTSIRPGKNIDDPTVTNMRALRYTPDDYFIQSKIFWHWMEKDTYKNKEHWIYSFHKRESLILSETAIKKRKVSTSPRIKANNIKRLLIFLQ